MSYIDIIMKDSWERKKVNEKNNIGNNKIFRIIRKGSIYSI